MVVCGHVATGRGDMSWGLREVFPLDCAFTYYAGQLCGGSCPPTSRYTTLGGRYPHNDYTTTQCQPMRRHNQLAVSALAPWLQVSTPVSVHACALTHCNNHLPIVVFTHCVTAPLRKISRPQLRNVLPLTMCLDTITSHPPCMSIANPNLLFCLPHQLIVLSSQHPIKNSPIAYPPFNDDITSTVPLSLARSLSLTS